MKNTITLLLLFFLVLATGCRSTKLGSTDNQLKVLTKYMTGTFNSAEQANLDSAFFDITLQMYPIWQDRKDGPWLYVEQAVTQAQERPYRQRVYHLRSLGTDTLVSTVYELPNPEKYIGKWQDVQFFNNLEPHQLIKREGCAVYLTPDKNGYFKGETGVGTCSSTLRGASYATSQTDVFPDKIVSWDRGYNADDKQVWGAEKGGYIFIKQ